MAETDLISRQAAIEALNGEINITGRANAEAVRGYVRLVKDRLERLPSAQPEPRWIPCSERLPEEGVNVLLCIKDWESQKTKMVVSLRRDYNYWDGLGRDIRGDIAWMPLPEPYRGERREE